MLERPPIAEPTERYWRRRANRRVRKERLLQAFGRWSRIVAVNGLVLGVLGAACIYIVRDWISSPFFELSQVTVSGLRQLDSESVLERLAPYRGTSLFELEIDALEHDLAEDPWVERCSIRRRLPDTLEVRVRELQPTAIAVIAGRAWLVDDSATIIEAASYSETTDLPVLGGVELESLPHALAQLRTLRERTPDFLAELSELDASRTDRLVAHTIAPGPALWLDPERVERNVQAFMQRRTEIDRRLGAPLVVDLRWDGQIAVTPAFRVEVE